MVNKLLLIFLLLIVGIYCDCTSPLAGGSSQQGNGMIVGSVVSVSGVPSSLTQIRIRPENYVQTPGAAKDSNGKFDAVTDMTGHFCVSGVNPGNYIIEANDRGSSAALVKTTVEEKNDTTDIGKVGLKSYASIAGTINTAAIAHSMLYVQVQGLERLVPVGADGTFSIKDLPEGKFNLQLIAVDSSVSQAKISSVKLLSGRTEQVVIAADWRYARRLYLNTTASGADVAGGVSNFPVLIRLTSNNFDFSQAKIDGSDIRFTKSDNTNLPYEIERWDAQNKQAEIWVKVDTLYGGDSTQSLTMHWGNVNVSGISNGASVFDTAAGFSGVWHLGESSDIVYDATGNAFDGVNSGTSTKTGIIGNARNFANGNYIKIPGLLKSPSNVTLSAWVQSDSTNEGQEIISLGDAVLIRLDNNGSGTTGSIYSDSITYHWVSSGKYLANTGWHYIVFSVNSETHVQVLYIDGVQCAISNYEKPINYMGLGTDTYIGKHGNGKTNFNFIGKIDEVRISSIPTDSDWIKLCYMNQKVQDVLVRW